MGNFRFVSHYVGLGHSGLMSIEDLNAKLFILRGQGNGPLGVTEEWNQHRALKSHYSWLCIYIYICMYSCCFYSYKF